MREKMMKSLNMELKDLNESKGEVTFYFAEWNPDQDGDVILNSAYNKTFKENLKNVYHNRDHKEAIGMPISFGIDSNGAFVTSQLAMKTIAGRDTFEQYQAGLIKGHSQEFETILKEYDTTNNIRIIKEVKLWGVTSVTHIPANLNTPVISMKSLEDCVDYMQKINKMLVSGKISDDLGEKILDEYKTMSEHIKSLDKKGKMDLQQSSIDYSYLAGKL